MNLAQNRLIKYFFEAKEELQKVTWPTRKEVTRYSALVIVVCIGLAAYFGVIDWGMQLGLEELLQFSTSAPSGSATEIVPDIDVSNIQVEGDGSESVTIEPAEDAPAEETPAE